MQTFRVFVFVLLSVCFADAARALAADDSATGDNSASARSSSSAAPAPIAASKEHFNVGVGVKVSTLGIGGDLALPVTHRSNLRLGFNAFNYNYTFNKDGVTYKGALDLRSAQALFDIFPFKQASI
jgi:hypothetical protein